MHFQIEKTALLSCLNMVERATSPNNPKKILAGIKLEARQNELVVTANNLEIAIQTIVPCTITASGEAIVDGRLLSALIRRLPDDQAVFELRDSQVIVTTSSTEFSLNTIGDDEFPVFPLCEQHILTLTDYEMEHLVRHSVFASSREDHQPIFSGVLLEIDAKKLQFIATDSNRLSFIQAATGDILVDSLRLIVPSVNLTELARCLPMDETAVKVYYGQNQLAFQFNETIFVSRLISGNFPNYRQVIFLDQETSVVLKKDHFLQALERASLFIRNESIPVVIEVDQGVMEIGISTLLGKASERLTVKHTGKSGQAAYSPRFLLDMLRITDSEEVEFRFEGPRQALLKAVGNDDHLYILMPMRI